MPLKARLLWSKKHIRGGRSNAANDPATDLRGSLLRGRSAASVHSSDNSVVLAVRLLLYMEPLCLQPAEADIRELGMRTQRGGGNAPSRIGRSHARVAAGS